MRTFVAVAEEANVTRAAKRLHTSQPAVSAHVKMLEEELGVFLFTRTPKGMLLTAEGHLLLERARTVLTSVETLHRQAAELRQSVTGQVRIGLNTDPCFLRVAQVSSSLTADRPNIVPHFLSSHSEDVSTALDSGQLDVAYIYGTGDSQEVEVLELASFKLVVVAPPTWKDKLENATLEDLADMPWLWFTERCPFSNAAQALFAGCGKTPNTITVSDQESMLSALVTSGCGLTLLREDQARAAQQAGAATLWLTESPNMTTSLAFLRRRREEPLLRATLQAVQNAWNLQPQRG